MNELFKASTVFCFVKRRRFTRTGSRMRQKMDYLTLLAPMKRAAGESFIGSVNLRIPSYL